jgi:hypothetical protein
MSLGRTTWIEMFLMTARMFQHVGRSMPVWCIEGAWRRVQPYPRDDALCAVMQLGAVNDDR